MKKISKETLTIIERIQKMSGKKNDSECEIELIRLVEAAGETAAVPYLLPLLLRTKRTGLWKNVKKPSAVAKAAAKASATLIRQLRPVDLSQLDLMIRNTSPWAYSAMHAWDSFSAENQKYFDELYDDKAAISGVLSCHRSGFVREEAVRNLAMSDDPLALSFLFLRVNDWVSQVRSRALTAIRQRLTPEHSKAFAYNLPLIQRLAEFLRHDHTNLIQSIHALLQGSESQASLFELLGSEDYLVRRAAYPLLVEAHGVDLEGLLARALNDTDIIIRIWAAKTVVEQNHGKSESAMDPGAFDRLLVLMNRDRHSAVRAISLDYYVSTNHRNTYDRLIEGLLDTSGSIRYFSRYYLEKRGEMMEFSSFYRKRLSDSIHSRLVPIIRGLGDTGTSEDVTLLERFVISEGSKVTRAALRSIASLNPNGSLPVMMQSLDDRRPAVSKEAFRILRERRGLTYIEELLQLASRGEFPHCRFAALHLATNKSNWKNLPIILRAHLDLETEIIELAKARLRVWIHQYRYSSYALPPPKQHEIGEIKSAFDETAPKIETESAEKLSRILKETSFVCELDD